MKYIFLILLAISTTIHLIYSWNDNSKKRNRTKPLLLIFVLLYYIFSTDKISPILCGALATSWLGDVLLMGKGNKWFAIGGISFMFSHVLFIIVYAQHLTFENLKLWIIIPTALVYFGIAFFIVRSLTPSTPKTMIAPMYLYLLFNSAMNIFSLMQLLINPCIGTIVAYIGAILFFVSDCTLYLVRYHNNKNLVFKKHFTVMLTYVLGELLITQGMLMIQ